MIIVLHKTLLILALFIGPIFAKSLRHHKREDRLKESAWSVKSDPKAVTYHDSEGSNHGSEILNVLSDPKGHLRYYRGSENYALEKNERHSGNLHHGFHRGAQEAAGFREVRNPVSDKQQEAVEEHRPFSDSEIKSKRSSAPLEEEEDENNFEGERLKNSQISAEDEANLNEADGNPRYSNQLDVVGVDDSSVDSADAESVAFGEIEKGEEAEEDGPNIGSSFNADENPYLNSDSEYAGDAEDGVPSETKDHEGDTSNAKNSLQEQGRMGYYRDSRGTAVHQRDINLRGPFEVRRSKYKGQDDDMNEKEEDSEQEWDGVEYNNEDSAIDFPHEKGYLDVKGLDSDLAADEGNLGKFGLVARSHLAGAKMSGE